MDALASVNLVRDHLPWRARPRARMAMTGLARVPISYPLESERLRLRGFTAGDLDALLAIQSRPDVARWLYWEPRGEEEVRAALEKKMTETTLENDGDSLSLAVVLKESSDLIGDALLLLMSAEHRQAEIGFVFHPAHHGHGYATETARVLLKLAFDVFGLHRVMAGSSRGTPPRRASLSVWACVRKRTSPKTSSSRANGRASSSTRCWMGSGESDRPEHCPRESLVVAGSCDEILP